MRDILSDLDSWRSDNQQIALATVIQTWGSSPRRAGAKMALTPDNRDHWFCERWLCRRRCL